MRVTSEPRVGQEVRVLGLRGLGTCFSIFGTVVQTRQEQGKWKEVRVKESGVGAEAWYPAACCRILPDGAYAYPPDY
jgi:hypothetical protein